MSAELLPEGFLDLTGRSALVTGAGQGVGKAVARHLAARGARVLVNDVVGERAQAVADELNEHAPTKAVAAPADVTSYDDVAAMVESAGPIDILVNNAGNAGTTGGFGTMAVPFWETDPTSWDGFLDVNLKGAMHLTHAVLPGMIERPHGRIVTIISDAGRVGEPRLAAYAASKAGAAGFTRSIARAVARYGATANCVSLSTVRDPERGAPATTPEQDAQQLQQYVVKRFGTPDDVAGMVLMLASDAGSWITGQTIGVNGGYCFTL